MTRKIGVPHKIKDNVFVDLFSDPENQVRLLERLYPDEHISQEDITDVTIRNVVSIGIYNDLGMRIKDRLVVLMEAQATWTPNILIRLAEYLMVTYRQFFDEYDQDIFSPKKVQLPRADLFVVYVGPKSSKAALKTLSLTDEFFNGVPCSFEVKASVISTPDGSDVLSQYMAFSQRSYELKKNENRTMSRMLEFIENCKEDNILKDYLTGKEEEVARNMMELFDQEDAVRRSTKAQAGQARKEGREEGRAEGREEGENRLIQLMSKLYAVGRGEEVERVTHDEAYRKELYKEFGLTAG